MLEAVRFGVGNTVSALEDMSSGVSAKKDTLGKRWKTYAPLD